MLACCLLLLDAQAPPKWPNDRMNRLKYYVLELGDPNPNPNPLCAAHHNTFDTSIFGPNLTLFDTTERILMATVWAGGGHEEKGTGTGRGRGQSPTLAHRHEQGTRIRTAIRSGRSARAGS